MAQLVISAVGAVVGGVVGYFAGGPSGAVYGAEVGWAIGGVAGALLIHQRGPQPGDLRIQDSAYGKPIPVVYSMYRVAGNIIWAGQPSAEDSGGKGGAGKGASQSKVQMSMAIGLCEGPITGVRRIWANGKLIYDVSDPSNFEAISGSQQMVSNFTLYLGDETQQPDPTMQGALGAANVPAYRGLAYIVFNNIDLSPWGNYIPSFSFELTTTSPSSYFSKLAAKYTDAGAPLAFTGMAPHLTAQGGRGTYHDFSFGVDAPLQSVDFSAYNAILLKDSTPTRPIGFDTWHSGNSDHDGALMFGADGYLYWFDGFTGGVEYTGYNGGADTFVREGLDLYISTGGGSANIVYITLSVDVSGSAINGTSALSGTLKIYGLTPSYLYVADTATHTLYRLHRNSMTVAGSWVNALFDGSIRSGCVFSDDDIYTLQGGSLTFTHFQPSTNTATALGQWANLGTISPDQLSLKAVNKQFFVASCIDAETYSAMVSYFWLGDLLGDMALSDIVANICARAGLTSGQYDVTQLTDRVRGYGLTNHSITRANLAPLMATYFFDAVDADGLIKFVKRGSNAVGAIAFADLGASTQVGDTQNTDPITEVISQEVDLPRSLSLTYPGLNSDYNPNTQRAFRAVTRSNKDAIMNAPIVLSDDDALMRSQTMLWSAWIGRKSFSFSTRLGYLLYEPGDVMTLNGDDGETYTVRLVRCQYDGQGALVWSAVLEEPDIYPSPNYTVAGGPPSGFNAQAVGYSGPTALVVLDVPPLRDSDTSQGLYLAACGYSDTWPGCVVDVSRDGLSYSDLLRITSASPIGYVSAAPGNFFGGNQPDELNSITVVLYSGTLASVSYADFLAGLSAAYMGGELFFFRNATQTGPNTYVLTGLLRGRVGTEWAMGAHAVGEQFVFLDPTRIAAMPLNLSDIGATLYFEPHLLNLFLTQAVTPTTDVPAVARVKPLSPVLFVAGHGSASSVSDISLSWIRRARVNAQWNDGADVPLDESAETYTLNILNGSTVVRTVTVSAATAYTYTAANITADGFSAGNTIAFTVQQNSDQGVIGYAATATITR
jgi:hypothetical protein